MVSEIYIKQLFRLHDGGNASQMLASMVFLTHMIIIFFSGLSSEH